MISRKAWRSLPSGILGIVAVAVLVGAVFLLLSPASQDGFAGAGPYRGPTDAVSVLASCSEQEVVGCVTGRLSELLLAKGAGVAFDALDELTRLNTTVNTQSHPIAHDLGRYAYSAYGDIQTTLANCSYKVFQGCLHGALQAHFEALPEVNGTVVAQTCPVPRNDFEKYACLHGLGHGLFLHTGRLNASLALCDALPDWFGQSSCYGGAFMENFVGWTDAQAGAAHQHHHHGAAQEYMIDRTRPTYPCDAVAEQYQSTCWLLQTSVVLWLNGGDFEKAAHVCDEAGGGNWTTDCYRSLGRDASAYAARDPAGAQSRCSHGSETGRRLCIRGYVSEVIHNDADPARGLDVCPKLAEANREPCYDEMAVVSRNMLDANQRTELCDAVEEAYRDACLQTVA